MLDTLRRLVDLIDFIISHPMNRGAPIAGVWRFFKWQVKSRLSRGPLIVDWFDGVRFYASRGESGVTGNIYAGLHEYTEMAFLLHYLREADLFVDVGANSGSYTLLASGIVRARTRSYEPVASTFQRLQANIRLNHLEELVDARQCGVGERAGIIRFTQQSDTMNHVAVDGEPFAESAEVLIVSLDDDLADMEPSLLKIDVEGYEFWALSGAERTLSSRHLRAVILELNGSGLRYGVRDDDIAALLFGKGFDSYTYIPESREIVPLNGKIMDRGNTLFLKDLDVVRTRVKDAQGPVVFGRTV